MSKLSLLATLLLAGCSLSEPKPSDAEMDRIETVLMLKPCIGKLADWDRRYNYQLEFSADKSEKDVKRGRLPEPVGHNRKIVEIDLREANFEGFGSGRSSYADYPPGSTDIDDREYNIALGTYNLETGELHLTQCGPSM